MVSKIKKDVLITIFVICTLFASAHTPFALAENEMLVKMDVAPLEAGIFSFDKDLQVTVMCTNQNVKVQSGAIADPEAGTIYNGNMSISLRVDLYRRYVKTYFSSLRINATEFIDYIFEATESFPLIEVGETKVVTFTISRDRLVKPSQKYADERFFLDLFVSAYLEESRKVPRSDGLVGPEMSIMYIGQCVGNTQLEINDASISALLSQIQRYSVDAEKYSRWYYETLANLDSQKSITFNLQSQITSLQQEKSILNQKITDLQTEIENYKVQNSQLESEKDSINTRVSDLTNYVIIEAVAITALIAIIIDLKIRRH